VSTTFVGNDIVDLEQPRTRGRADDDRFVDRVFDEDERAAIRSAPDGDAELWARWAAKEAGFKVISKLLGAPPPFVHRAFKVTWTEVGAATREGRVTYGGHSAHLSVRLCPEYVHAFGCGAVSGLEDDIRLHPSVVQLDAPDSPWSGALEALRERFTERELDAVYSRQSAAVRLGARAELAATLPVDEKRLQIVCDPGPTSQRPPRVLLDGTPTEADVSLSHDGRWLAWVLWKSNQLEKT
jgi:phosphopantetheine--protein transferase-like protein